MEAGMSDEETRHYENTNKKMIIKWDKIIQVDKDSVCSLAKCSYIFVLVVNNYRI